MEIIKNTSIRDKYHEGYERSSPPSEIVVHGTAGGSSAGAIVRWMEGGERGESYRKGVGLFHFLIGLKGEAVEIIDPDRWVYHSSAGRHDSKTIGIELVNPQRDNGAEYTEAQYEALQELCGELMARYSISVIRGHSRSYSIFTGGTKPGPRCPGNFDWQVIGKMLSGINHGFDSGSEEYLNIYEVA